MKYLVIGCALLCICFAGVCRAEDAKGKVASDKVEVIKVGGEEGMKHIDTSGGNAMEASSNWGLNKKRVMPPYQTYDQQTGMPNNVESDTAGEIKE